MDNSKTPPKVQVEACEVYNNLPDGRYKARVESAEYKLSKNSKPMIVYEFVITKGFFAKRHVWKYSVVSDNGVERIREDARRLGIAADCMDELIARLPAASGAAADITLKTSMYRGRQTQFVYINEDNTRDIHNL